MSQHKNCRYQGLGYKNKNGIDKCICDRTGKAVCKSYCFNICKDYQPRKRSVLGNETY